MSRIAHLLPVVKGREGECLRLFQRHAGELDSALRDLGVTQCLVLMQGDSLVVVVDWLQASYVSLVRRFVRHPAVQGFIGEVRDLLDIPLPRGSADPVRDVVEHLEGRALREAYSLQPAP